MQTFLADENLRRAVVFGVRRREPSISFLQAFEVGIAGKDDLAALQIAAEKDAYWYRMMSERCHDISRSSFIGSPVQA